MVRQLCDGSRSFTEIGRLINRSKPAIVHRARALGLSNDYSPRLYVKDEAFFQTPNPVSSYYAGLIAADGTVDWKQHAVRWSLEEGDREALETFQRLTGYTGKIGFRLNHGLGANPSRQCYLDVYGARKWCEDLHRNFGIVPAKAHRVAPPNTVNDLLNACFILGYIDGDGSVSFTENGGWCISITSACPRVLEFIKAFCERHFHGLRPTKGSSVCHYDNHYVYSVKGYRAVQLFDFMRALPVPKMARKWEDPGVLAVIAARKAKQPQLFDTQPLSFDESGMIRRHALVESDEGRVDLAPVIPLAAPAPAVAA